MLRPTRACAFALVALPLVACSGGNAASAVSELPAFEPKGQTKCGVTKSQAKPLVVEWPSPDRAELESRARDGLVAVRYEGCEMEVLGRCKVVGQYRYTGVGLKTDHVTIKDADELYAKVPIGAAKLESMLQRTGELTAAMTIVGRYDAGAVSPRPDELVGADCSRATHVITALTVGAFDFFAGADATVGAGAAVMGAGAGARSVAKRETISTDGKSAACETSTSADARPPEGCSAILRIEVTPIHAPAPICPEGSTWDGRQCVRTQVVTEVRCPAGTHRAGDGCAADVSTSCAVGLHFVAGHGCVPNAAAAPAAWSGPDDRSATASILGTLWSGIDSDGEKITREFRADGQLRYSSSGIIYNDGAWKQVGSGVSWEVNDGYSQCEGTIEGARMTGKCKNTVGHAWTWSLQRAR